MSTPAAVRVWGSNWAQYRHMWRADAAGNLLQPLLYLLGMGIGVGALVDANGQTVITGNLKGAPGGAWTKDQINAGGRWEVPAGAPAGAIGRNFVPYVPPPEPRQQLAQLMVRPERQRQRSSGDRGGSYGGFSGTQGAGGFGGWGGGGPGNQRSGGLY